MNFLTPAFLFGALALALPVVFHLIRRSTRERLPFSSLLFLSPTPPRLTKRSRLEDLLLLLLRCLALALLAFGFARPFLKNPVVADPAAGQPRRLVVLVDRSASMQRAGLWSAALAQAADVLGKTTPGDQVAVLAFDHEVTRLVSFEDWQAAPAGDRAALTRSKLEALKPGWGATQIGTALVAAAETLTEADVHEATQVRQVVLISDVQEGGRLQKLQAYDWPKNIQLLALPLKAKSVSNAGVQVVADTADTNPTNSAVRVRVSNAPESAKDQFQVGWAAEGETFVGQPTDVYVPPGQSRVVALPLPPSATNGAASARRVVLRGDEEPFDNVAYVIPPEPTTLRVLYLGADAAGDARQPLFFLRRALPDSPRQRVELDARPANSTVSPAELVSAGLVFVTSRVTAPTADALKSYVSSGKTVVLTMLAPDTVSTLARLISEPGREITGSYSADGALGRSTVSGRPGIAAGEANVRNYAMLTEMDLNHPLFAPFADPRFSDFTKIHVWKHRVLDLAAVSGARVVAKFDSGSPAIAEVPVGRGRVVVLATGWHPEDSQLALSTKFVPLLLSLLDYAGATVGLDPLQHLVGEPVALWAGAKQVRLPDGTEASLAAGATNFTGAALPGIYEVESGGAPQLFAVNLDPSESRTAPLSADVFETYGIVPANQPETTAVGNVRKAQLQAAEAESRQKLWRWFLLGTLLMLLIETALAGWTARRAIPTEATA